MLERGAGGTGARFTTVRLAYYALFIALSAVGANIKIPSLTGTPALDALPGYLAALLLGPGEGALIISVGHLLTSLTAGFPLSLPIHLLIAGGMAVCAGVFALVARWKLWAGAVVGILMNGVLFPAMFILVPGFGVGFFAAMLVPLLVSSGLNVIGAVFLYLPLKGIVGKRR